MSSIAMAACQINPLVGDVEGNVTKMLRLVEKVKSEGASLAIFPELSISGYPPEDLLAKPSYLRKCASELDRMASQVNGITVIVGVPEADQGDLFNSAAIIDSGKVVRFVRKELLPNYLVFDEKRYFSPGTGPSIIFDKDDVWFGVSICEDAWFADGPISKLAAYGAEVVININASPYSIGKRQDRAEMLRDRSTTNGISIVYVNQVGGQDELVFDGASMVIDGRGVLVATAIQCAEEIMIVDLEWDASSGTVVSAGHGQVRHLTPLGQPLESSTYTGFSPGVVEAGLVEAEAAEMGVVEAEVYSVLVLGTRDYLFKNGFSDAVIGLSGGIDSSLVAVIAADAVGSLHTHCIAMPSRYSSVGSLEDARLLAENAGIDLSVVPIEDAHSVLSEGLKEVLGAEPSGLADENMQSRIRGVILMAVSNANGWIVLTTGNKSELATGYSTLYGDTAGGFAVIKDVPKTMVYRLARYRNKIAGRELIPQTVLDKPPSAELRPDQRDDQSLPPYDLLDPIMNGLVEQDMSIDELVSRGFDPQIVSRVARLIDLAEYKRRQSPPGIKITTKAFGKDRRVPITNHYRDIPATDLSSDKA